MIKLCVMKPHEDLARFKSENKYGVDKLREAATKAFELYCSTKEELKVGKPGVEARLLNSDIVREYMSPENIEAIRSGLIGDLKRLCSYKDGLTDSYYPENSPILLHIYGNLKLGERSQGQLLDDMQEHFRYSERHKTSNFDLDSCIQVGLSLVSNSRNILYFPDEPGYVCFDVSAVLVRVLNGSTSLANAETYENALVSVMYNKLITLGGSICNFQRIVANKVTMPEDIVAGNWQSGDLKEVLTALFIYKAWYNAINGFDDDFDKTVDDIVELVDLAAKSFNATQAITDVYNTIHTKLQIRGINARRRPDVVIDAIMDFYRTASNYYSYRSLNGRRAHAGISRSVSISTESVLYEKMLSSFGVESIKEEPATKFLGFESTTTSSREYDDFKRSTRAYILSKLSNDERKVFIKYESDLLKYKSECIGCKTEFTQNVLLKKGETYGKLINMELGRDNISENLSRLLSMLDTERVNIQGALADRNLFKERNTMLNGHIGSLKDEWTY